MTYLSDAPHASDARAYTPGGLVGRNDLVDLERQHRQLKLLRELQDARAAQDSAPHQDQHQYHHRPPPVLGSAHPQQLLELPARGPVIWRGSSAAGPAPTAAQHHSSHALRHPDDALRSSHKTPSIHTLLELARSHSIAPATSNSSSSAPVSLSASHTRRPAADIVVRRDDAPTRQRAAASSSGTQARTGTSVSPTLAGVRFPVKSLSSSSSSSPPSAEQQQRLHALHQQPLRRGKWTKAEEEFAAATIQYFCSGLLNLQFGTLLRGFLAQQLHCHPMRISKKLLPGTTFCGVEISRKLGRRAYSPRWCDSPEATQQKLDAETHLSALRMAFLTSLDQEGDESDERPSDASARSTATASPDTLEDRNRLHASRESVKSESRRAGSPTYLDEQQQGEQGQQQQSQRHASAVPPLQQQQQQQQQAPPVSGRKRTREDWAADERERHFSHPPRHAPFTRQYDHHHHPQQQQQLSLEQRYSSYEPLQQSTVRALGPPCASSSSAPSGWYPVRPATAMAPPQTVASHPEHTGMRSYQRAHSTMHPQAMAFRPQQQQQHRAPERYEHRSGSMEAPPARTTAQMLPSLRASLHRASATATATPYSHEHELRF